FQSIQNSRRHAKSIARPLECGSPATAFALSTPPQSRTVGAPLPPPRFFSYFLASLLLYFTPNSFQSTPSPHDSLPIRWQPPRTREKSQGRRTPAPRPIA